VTEFEQTNDAEVIVSASSWQPTPPPIPSPTRAALIADAATLVDRHGRRRLRVCVDGLTASGKSSFGHELATAIAGRNRQVLRASLDDFKRPWSEAHLYDRTSGEGYYRNAFDYDRCTTLLLEPSGPTGSGVVALCSIDPLTQRDHAATTVGIRVDGVLIVDGVFAQRPELDAYWDLRIWLDVDLEDSLARGARRDASLEGSDEAAEALHRSRYLPAEMLYIAECDPASKADIVIDNREFSEPRVLRWPA
jgi:uridine kinase